MPPEASQHPHAAPLAELLGRIGAELTDLAATVERLHPLASAHARQATTPHAAPTPAAAADIDYVQALQDLDHSEQKLRALAGFLADLARATDPDWRLDPHPALAAITLADLAARLAGTPAHDATPPGDIELF